jgi:hypothetical protein
MSQPATFNTQNDKVILVLPTVGSPYLWKSKVFDTSNKVGKDVLASELRKVVRGGSQKIENTTMKIHPMFENRWKIADAILKEKDVEIYGNENGGNECSPNMACLRLERVLGGGGMMSAEQYMALPLKVARVPYFGEIGVVMPHKVLRKHIHPDCLTLVRVEDFYEEIGVAKPAEPSTEKDYEQYLGGYIYEPNDATDEKKFNVFAKEKGWYRQSMGQVFLKPTGRSDEQEEESDEEESDEDESDEDESDEDEKETPEERASRISKEDEEIQKKRREEEEKTGLLGRQQKRKTAFLKNKTFIEGLVQTKKGIKYRTLLSHKLAELAEFVFPTEEKEYQTIGKFGRGLFDETKMKTAFNKSEMKMITDLAREYGAFDY